MFVRDNESLTRFGKTAALAALTGLWCLPATAQSGLDRIGGKNDISGPAKAMVCGDFDGDGMAEIAVAKGSNAGPLFTVTLYDNPSSMLPTTALASVQDVLYGSGTSSLAAGDFDGDGRDEVAFGHVGTDSRLEIWVFSFGNALAAGGLWLDAKASIVVGDPTHSLVAGDFDADGIDELAVTCIDGSGMLAALVHDIVGGNFQRSGDVRLVVGSTAHRGSAGDYDGDGREDLALIKLDGRGRAALLAYRFQRGTAPQRIGDVRYASHSFVDLTSGDFDGDGRDDVGVLARESGRIRIYPLEMSAGTFTSSTSWIFAEKLLPALATARKAVASADLDQDGRDEIVYLAGSDIEICNADVGTPQRFSSGMFPEWVCTGDLDGDGRGDFVTMEQDEFDHDFQAYEHDAAATIAPGCAGYGSAPPQLVEDPGSNGRFFTLHNGGANSAAWLFITLPGGPPVDLGGLGLPGCTLVYPVMSLPMLRSGNEHRMQLLLSVYSYHLHVQALSAVPGGGGWLVSSSNALDVNYPLMP